MALTVARRYTEATMFSCPEGAEVCNMFEKVRSIFRQSPTCVGPYLVSPRFRQIDLKFVAKLKNLKDGFLVKIGMYVCI